LILRNERGPDPCEATEFSSNKSGFDENWLEKSDYDTGICSQNGIDACNGVQAVHLCSDTSSDNDFCLVVYRKRARKEKKMSLWRSYGECASTITNVQNEKYVGRAPMRLCLLPRKSPPTIGPIDKIMLIGYILSMELH